MRLVQVLGLMLLSINMAFATNMDGFHKRFKIKKNDNGTVAVVKMKMFSDSFSIRPYLMQIKNDIKAEVARMRSSNKVVDSEIDEFIATLEEDMDSKSVEAQENIHRTRRSLRNLPNINVEGAFNKVGQRGVLAKFEVDLNKIFRQFSLTTIANTDDARFFYRRNVTYEVVTRALNFAKKKFDNVPILNLASFIIVKVHDLLLEQRLFHQNMLMHYVQNHEAELGLAKVDVDKIMSSIYESRIAPINFRESKYAAANWGKFGFEKFYGAVRMANTKLRSYTARVDKVGNRINYAFVEATEKGERVIKNLVDSKHMFSMQPATAYYMDKPNKVYRTRALLNLAQVGMGFLPIPGWIKGNVQSFLSSYYENHKRTEGALIGYFESRDNQKMVDAFYKQAINPYLLR